MSSAEFERMGGEAVFTALVHGFYQRVREDDLLAPMYPEGDFEGAEWRLRSFLVQYWGWPAAYSAARGHPMLRRRHAAFPIDAAARDRWLTHMRAALDELALDPDVEGPVWDHLSRAASAMENS